MSRAAIVAALASAAILAAGAAGAQGLGMSRGYFKLFGGATFPQDDSFGLNFPAANETLDSGLDYYDGYIFGVAGGYFVTPQVALELEYAYRDADADVKTSTNVSGQMSSNAYMVNAIYNFGAVDAAGAWKPYAGAGLGAADLTYAPDNAGRLGSDLGFAYQVMGGVGYQVNESWTLSGELRWFAISGEDVSSSTADFKTSFETIDALVAATYRF
jgi:opacity protein-like surface antigen